MTELTEFTPSYASKHGCAWFEPDVKGGRQPFQTPGWAAVGGLPAFRFESWRDLPTDVVWWTNLSQAEAWSLGRMAQFKDGGLFGPEWPGLMTEAGHGASEEAIAAAVSVWSEIFARCAEWLSAWAGTHDARRPWEWGEGSLADALAQRWGLGQIDPETPQPVLEAAYIEAIRQEIPGGQLAGRRRVVLAFPRRGHVRALWNTPFPDGRWRALEDRSWPRDDGEKLRWLREQDKPVLVRIMGVSWRTDQAITGALWLGLRGRRFPAAEVEPIWMTGEEAIRLGTYADLHFGEGYIGGGWTSAEPPTGFPMTSEDPLIDLSWSQALISASAWKALASPTREPHRRTKAAITSRAVWWRAADREKCFRAALTLHSKGWTVLSHGQGQITLLIDPSSQAEELAEAIAEAGLLMPAMLAKIAPLLATADHSEVAHVDRWLKQQGGVAALIDVDRLVAPWPGPAAHVKAVLEPAVKRLDQLASPPNETWGAWWKNALRQQARKSVDRIKALRK